MNKQVLQEKLERLRTELAGTSKLDEKTYIQLRTLVADIERAIGPTKKAPTNRSANRPRTSCSNSRPITLNSPVPSIRWR